MSPKGLGKLKPFTKNKSKMKKILSIALLCLSAIKLFALEPTQDSVALKELVIVAPKEVGLEKNLPVATYSLGMKKIEDLQIGSLKDISLVVPNFYIPDYGSKLTSSIYVRGIGSRMNEPSIGLYVDNIPYLDKSGFDFDFFDIQSISLMQGPQGTLYGRNAIGGLINIYTLSPLSYQGTRLAVSYGNYNDQKVNFSHYQKFNDKMGISLAGYYRNNDGYFTNTFNGDKNSSQSFGGRVKLDWILKHNWKKSLSIAYDHVNQKAYPYAQYDTLTQKAKAIDYNDNCSYLRDMVIGGLCIQHEGKKSLFTSATSFQYLKDKMQMDQDFTPDSIFALIQKQSEKTVTQEFVFRSKSESRYQFVCGLFGFYKNLDTNSPMTFEKMAIDSFIQKYMPPFIQITDTSMPIPGDFKTHNYGAAIYHQSTYAFNKKLSITAGLRLDYEKIDIDYNTHTTQNMIVMGNPVSIPYSVIGKQSHENIELLPKLAMKYNITNQSNLYASAANGYKAGGYNYEMFSDILQAKMQSMPEGDIEKTISYKPEYSWDYELGTHNELIKNKLFVDGCLFYIDDRNQQMTITTNAGSRIITNASKVENYGVEANICAKITHNLTVNATYGYTHASFKEYTDTVAKINYKGKFVPFVPQNTLSVGAEYGLPINKKLLDKIVFAAQYLGVGKIYWNEANTNIQQFYGLLNGQISFVKKSFQLTAWTKNALNQEYNSFYFESLGKSFVQKGIPTTLGLSAKYEF